MEYWKGFMSWPLKADWKCEICGKRSLTWGFINGQCRCDFCHTQYLMRIGDEIKTAPQIQLKPEYKTPITEGYNKYKTPYDEWTEEQWYDILPENTRL
jgi:hypothetical protein